MKTRLSLSVVVGLFIIGTALLLELGAAFFIMLTVLPFSVALALVREQHIYLTRHCVQRYLCAIK